MDMTSFLTSVSGFIDALVVWLSSLLGFVTANPPLLVFVLIALAGSVIGIVRRWLPGRA